MTFRVPREINDEGIGRDIRPLHVARSLKFLENTIMRKLKRDFSKMEGHTPHGIHAQTLGFQKW